jgi:hypothetical protein
VVCEEEMGEVGQKEGGEGEEDKKEEKGRKVEEKRARQIKISTKCKKRKKL